MRDAEGFGGGVECVAFFEGMGDDALFVGAPGQDRAARRVFAERAAAARDFAVGDFAFEVARENSACGFRACP